MAEDGKVVFKYEGDTSGIDAANTKAVEKVKNAGQQSDDEIKKAGKKIVDSTKATGDEVVANTKTAADKVDQAQEAGAATLGQRITQKLGITASSIKTTLGAVGVGVADFLGGTVSSAAAAQKKTEDLTNLLKNQGETSKTAGANIKTFSKTITDMSDFSGGEAKDALTVLTQKGLDVGKSLDAASTIANVAAGRNIDLASAADIVADAYNGKTKALVSLGILSKDEVKQLGDSEDASISMADVQDRLNKRFGGAAQTDLKSYSGQIKEQKNQWNAAKTQIGTALLPVLSTLLGYLSKIITPVAEFIAAHPKVTAGILGIISVFGILFGGMSLVNTVLGVFNGLTAASAVATAAQGVAAGGASVGIWAMLAPVLIVIAAIAALIAITVLIVTHFTEIKGFFATLWSDITNIFWNAINGIKGFFTSIIDFIKNNWAQLLLFLVNPIAGALALLYNLNPQFRDWVNGIGEAIKNGFNSAIDFITSLPGKALGWGKDMIQGFIDGIKNMISNVGNAVSDIADKVKSFLHFSQPDEGPLKEFPDWPVDMMKTWGDQLSGNDDFVVSAVKSVTGKISATVQQAEPVSGTAAGGASALVDQAIPAFSQSYRPSTSYIDQSTTKTAPITINGDVNLADKGSQDATLQQLDILSGWQ